MASNPAPAPGAIPLRVLVNALSALTSARRALAGHGDRVVAVEVANAEGALEFHVQNLLPDVAVNRDPTQ